MLKIFISQPMNGRTEKEILKERQEIENILRKYFSLEDVYILDSFIEKAQDVNPLFCLGHSIMELSKADYAVFAPEWANSRGCCIEYNCCQQYGIKILYINANKITQDSI